MLDLSPKARASRETPDFLAGGGELGERMRALQWTRTPLGTPGEWPQPLRQALRLMLASRQPMSLWWGDGHTHLYNDACRPLLGPGHPSALGMAARVVWGDWWDELEGRADVAIRCHEGSTTAPLRFLVERNGRALESYFTMSAHAVPGELGAIGGVLWTFSDVTAGVLREREMAAVALLRKHLADVSDVRDVCAHACYALAAACQDLPFCALYSVDAAATEARLVARSGVNGASETLPEALMLGEACVWPFATALAQREALRVRLDDPRFGRLPRAPWDRAPREALMMPVCDLDAGARLVLVAGVNPYRTVDVAFERFAELVREEIASAVESTLRKRLAALEHTVDELRELDRRRIEFLATLAHELRNPLAPLRNGLEVIRLSPADPPKVEKARAMMQRQLQQMVNLVEDLLDASRVSRGKVELRPADVELAAVLRTAVEASQPLMGERGHALAARMPTQRIVVHGDATRLSQVFSNLLNNAAKYTEAGGHIELDATFEAGEAVVRVKDNGIGIPPEMHGRVFELFTQVDRSLERSQGGLGIGLSIARRLVEMHGGSISVKSEGLRKGSEFTVRLPARAEQPTPRAQPAAVPRAAQLGKRILVADDNADSAETLQIMLEVMGNDVRVARDGEEAVSMAADFAPDAILMDIGMPRLNGYDACARIRAAGSGATIIALTGWSQEEDKARSKQAGFDHHVVKPVEPKTLEGLIRAIK